MASLEGYELNFALQSRNPNASSAKNRQWTKEQSTKNVENLIIWHQFTDINFGSFKVQVDSVIDIMANWLSNWYDGQQKEKQTLKMS